MNIDVRDLSYLKNFLKKNWALNLKLYLFLKNNEKDDSMEFLTSLFDSAGLTNNYEVICQDEDLCKKFDISIFPTIIISNGKINLKYVGMPTGIMFSSILYDILMLTNTLSQNTFEKSTDYVVRTPENRTNIKLFVSSKCPYCPSMSYKIHKLQIFSNNFNTEIINIDIFQQYKKILIFIKYLSQ